jgi:hypothetical protein
MRQRRGKMFEQCNSTGSPDFQHCTAHLSVMKAAHSVGIYLEEQNARWSLQVPAFANMFSLMDWGNKAMRTSLSRRFTSMLERETHQHAQMLELHWKTLGYTDWMGRRFGPCSWFDSMTSHLERDIHQFLKEKQNSMEGFYMWLYTRKEAFSVKLTPTAEDMHRAQSHGSLAVLEHATATSHARKKERLTTQEYFMVEGFIAAFRLFYTKFRLKGRGGTLVPLHGKLFEDALIETDTIMEKLWEGLRNADETPQNYRLRLTTTFKEDISGFLSNERINRYIYYSDEGEQWELLLERHKRFISQIRDKQLWLKKELARVEQRRIAQTRLAERRRIEEERKAEQHRLAQERTRAIQEQRRIEEERKAEQRRLAQERTRAIQERRRAEEAQVEERRRAERERQAQRRMEIIRAEREGRTRGQDLALRGIHQPIMDLNSPGAPAPPRPSSVSDQSAVSPRQIQHAGATANSETTQPRSVEKSEKHAHDNGCVRVFFDGGVEGFFPKADFDKFKATFEISRFGLDLYRYLTLPKDESSTECNICLDASGLLTCGRNSGGKNCEGSLCWECFHSCFIEDEKCPLCRMDYIPLAKRSPTQPVRISAGKTDL